MEYLNKNIGGIWVSVPVSNATVKTIMTNTHNKNQAIMDKIKRTMLDEPYTEKDIKGNDIERPGYTEAERLAMFDKLAQHYHYAIDSFVSEMIDNGTITKEQGIQGDVTVL